MSGRFITSAFLLASIGSASAQMVQTPVFKAAAAQQRPHSSGGGGGGSITLINAAGIGGTSGACTTSGQNMTGATLFVGATGDYRTPYANQSDSLGNSWSGLNGQNSGSGDAIELWWSGSPTVGASQTFSADDADNVGLQYSSDGICGFSGCTTLDTQSTGSNSNNGSAQPGSLTPSQGGEVIVTAIGGNAGGSASTWGISTGYTIDYQGLSAGGLYFAIAHKIKSSGDSSPENPTWTYLSGSSPTVSCVSAAFK